MKPKLLLIGIDAMSPLVVTRLIKRGLLPHFAKLQFSPLATTTPPETPVAWSAAATGSNPGRYGIFDFIDRDPSTYLPKLCLTEEKVGLMKTEYKSLMRGTPFWKILNAAGISTTVIRWPLTFPAEAINGRLFAGLGAVDIKGSLNSYTFFSTDPADLQGKGAEKVTALEMAGNTCETKIEGPTVKKRGKEVTITCPLRLEKLPSGKLLLQSRETQVELAEGKWSPFFRLSFEILPFHFVRGIANAYLVSNGSHVRLYISSVQIDPSNQSQPLTSPPEYGKELEEQIGLCYTLGMPEETKAVTEGKLPMTAFVEHIKDIESQREAHLFFELSRFKEGVLAFIFDAGDRLKHLTWKELKDGSDSVPQEIEEYYMAKDRMLGKVLEQLDQDTKLIIMSDHGFSQFHRQVNINRWFHENGYLSLSGPCEAELFKSVNWSETKAYAVGFTSLFLNLAGREASGVVTTAQREPLLEEIRSKLLALKDGNNLVVENVHRGDQLYKGKLAHEAPDLVIGFKPGYRMSWQSALGLIGNDLITDNDSAWAADHLIDSKFVPGVIFTNFPISKQAPTIFDIAPTVLQRFGLPKGEEMDGEALG
jgi:predicted AlkP superfamily phosphohydrolase/phosphomutase